MPAPSAGTKQGANRMTGFSQPRFRSASTDRKHRSNARVSYIHRQRLPPGPGRESTAPCAPLLAVRSPSPHFARSAGRRPGHLAEGGVDVRLQTDVGRRVAAVDEPPGVQVLTHEARQLRPRQTGRLSEKRLSAPLSALPSRA